MNLSEGYHKSVRPERLMEIVDGTAAAIKKLRETVTFSHIVATGSSGQSITWPVAYKLGIPVCIVRKEGEKSHAGLVTGYGDMEDYVILDDFIGTGTTVKRVLDTIAERFKETREWCPAAEGEPKCKAIVLYDHCPDLLSNEKTFQTTGIPCHYHQFVPGY